MGNIAVIPSQMRVGLLTAALGLGLTAACGSGGGKSAPPSQSPTSTPTSDGRIVVRFNTGLESDTYFSVRPNGTDLRTLNVAGSDPAGFDRELVNVAVANQGALGSGNPETVLSVSKVGESKASTIWTVGDDLTTAPEWNPAGTRLAFGLTRIQSRGGQIERDSVPDGLWTIDSGADHSRRLLVNGRIGSLAWSPDGKTIAFVLGGSTQAQLETVPSTGGTATKVATIGSPEPTQPIAWSPDGRQILLALTVYAPGTLTWQSSGVYAYEPGGGATRTIWPMQSSVDYTGLAYSPSASEFAASVLLSIAGTSSAAPPTTLPQGSRILPPGSSYLELANADGSDARQVMPFSSRGEVVDWSS